MADYILRSYAIQCAKDQADDFNNENLFSSAEGALAVAEWLEDVPSADVRPVVRGRWNHDGSDWKNRFICDQCGYKWFFDAKEAKFCPNCGADMREGGNDG